LLEYDRKSVPFESRNSRRTVVVVSGALARRYMTRTPAGGFRPASRGPPPKPPPPGTRNAARGLKRWTAAAVTESACCRMTDRSSRIQNARPSVAAMRSP
jgi:hypothetical protein